MGKVRRNKTPFIILLIVHSIMLGLLLRNKGLKRSLQSLLPNIGMAYVFEYFVLNLWNAYTYYPNFIKNRKLDNVLGAILSQAIFVPITATFLTTFKLGWGSRIFYITYFYIVENLFKKLKIYKQNWWQTPFTSVLLPIYFLISDRWLKGIDMRNPVVTALSKYLTFVVIHVNLLFILAKKKIIRFGYKRFTWEEHFILTPLYSLFVSIFYTVSGKGKVKRLILSCILFTTDYLLVRGRFMKVVSWGGILFPIHLWGLTNEEKIRILFNKENASDN